MQLFWKHFTEKLLTGEVTGRIKFKEGEYILGCYECRLVPEGHRLACFHLLNFHEKERKGGKKVLSS